MMSHLPNWTHAKLLIALGIGILSAPVWGADMARPGAVNYVEGEVMLNGAPLNATSVGTAEVAPGQMIETQQGKTEVLLTPGVFLRLGDNSQLRMISPGLTDTRIELVRGSAMLEVTELMPENHLALLDAGSTTLIEKPGVYEFNAGPPQVRVYDGKASVSQGAMQVNLKKGRETAQIGRAHV